MELTSKQRAQLRAMANSMETIFQVGKDGIGENLISQVNDTLENRELIKGRVLDNNLEHDARSAAQELAQATRSEVVQVIGTRFVLYRESHSKPKEKRIELIKPNKRKPRPKV
ncbi:ribosome assembly RNA-binding protein YhbY [Bengtsoniella intestinalis]|uniref:ribosome assembly RNA-binding protein YhbY n=1 Tax=Bengtsoniella intestinalis TaxID=3073143 RepID=UPI00391F80CA